MIRAGGDEVAFHRPVVVFAEGEAVGGVVVAACGKGNQMCGCIQVLICDEKSGLTNDAF